MSMQSILNAHLGLPFTENCIFQHHPPPMYYTPSPPFNPYQPNGFYANASRNTSYHVNPFVVDRSHDNHMDSMSYGTVSAFAPTMASATSLHNPRYESRDRFNHPPPGPDFGNCSVDYQQPCFTRWEQVPNVAHQQ